MKMYKVVFYFDVCEKIVTEFIQAVDEKAAIDEVKRRYGSNSVVYPQISFKKI